MRLATANTASSSPNCPPNTSRSWLFFIWNQTKSSKYMLLARSLPSPSSNSKRGPHPSRLRGATPRRRRHGRRRGKETASSSAQGGEGTETASSSQGGDGSSAGWAVRGPRDLCGRRSLVAAEGGGARAPRDLCGRRCGGRAASSAAGGARRRRRRRWHARSPQALWPVVLGGGRAG